MWSFWKAFKDSIRGLLQGLKLLPPSKPEAPPLPPEPEPLPILEAQADEPEEVMPASEGTAPQPRLEAPTLEPQEELQLAAQPQNGVETLEAETQEEEPPMAFEPKDDIEEQLTQEAEVVQETTDQLAEQEAEEALLMVDESAALDEFEAEASDAETEEEIEFTDDEDTEEESEERSMISAAEIARNLRAAKKDWEPETHPSLPVNEAIIAAPPSSDPLVTIVTDPFNINTLEIQTEQIEIEHDLDRDVDADLLEAEEGAEPEAKPEQAASAPVEMTSPQPTSLESTVLASPAEEELPPLELQEDPAEAEAQLERIASAVAEQEKAREEELESQVSPQDAEEAASRLAREIAEDEALAGELARAQDEEAEADAALIAAMPKEPEMLADGSYDLAELQSCIEALLFMTDKPLSSRKLKELLTFENGPQVALEHFDEALKLLQTRYKHPCHGFELAEVAGGFQFRTKPGRAALARKLAKVQTQRLSSGAMETLAIVAYKQPVMKEDVDQIRGVDSSHFIRTLLDRKLIKISGRSELPGRPMLYGTTDEFLELFALKDLDSMPPLRELEAMIPNSESANPEDEDPRVKQMRKLVSQMNSDTSVSLIYDPKQDDQFLTDIREKVKGISITTEYLDQQKAAEEAAKQALKEAQAAGAVTPPPGLEGFAPQVEPVEPVPAE